MTHSHVHAHRTDGLVHVDNLTLCYHGRPAIHHLSVDLPAGGFVGVVGPNGAGKSTLLHGLLGWIPWTTGSVAIAGEAVNRCARRISFLPQRRVQDLDFPITVEGVVAMGRFQRLGMFQRFGADDQAAVDEAINEMGLQRLRDRPLSQLSGGQQQRTLLARSLATGADVLLLDEPLTGLDEPTAADLLQRLRDWASRDRLVIAVIHDLSAVRTWCSHALLVNRELIAFGPTVSVMDELTIGRCYQSGRFRAVTPHPHDHGDAEHHHG